MKGIEYYTVDVFANKKYEGNQLAVYLDFDHKLSDQEMQKIATEINFSESTFIRGNKDDQRFAVRIFTPEYEVPFAGHPSLGTAYIIAKFLLPESRTTLTLELAHGDIDISIPDPEHIDHTLIYMLQTQPEFRNVFTAQEISHDLAINYQGLNSSFPIQEVTTGLPYIIVPVNSLREMEKIKLDSNSLMAFLIKNKRHKSNSPDELTTSLFFFSRETYEVENDFNTRMFSLEHDYIVEDAATGSANGCFLSYLLKHENNEINAKVEQGFQMNRKSYLNLSGVYKNERYRIEVGGLVKLISKGVWFTD